MARLKIFHSGFGSLVLTENVSVQKFSQNEVIILRRKYITFNNFGYLLKKNYECVCPAGGDDRLFNSPAQPSEQGPGGGQEGQEEGPSHPPPYTRLTWHPPVRGPTVSDCTQAPSGLIYFALIHPYLYILGL